MGVLDQDDTAVNHVFRVGGKLTFLQQQQFVQESVEVVSVATICQVVANWSHDCELLLLVPRHSSCWPLSVAESTQIHLSFSVQRHDHLPVFGPLPRFVAVIPIHDAPDMSVVLALHFGSSTATHYHLSSTHSRLPK